MITCSKCGKQNADRVKFCTACGTPLQNIANVAQKQPSSPPNINSSKKLPVTTILIQIVIVFVICALIPFLLGTILGKPAVLLKGILPQWTCIGLVEGSPAMYLCSMKVGLMTMLPPILIMIVIFIFSKVLNKGANALNNKLPQNAQFVLPAVLATVIFTLAWAGYHAATWGDKGIVPHKIFPAFVGLFTYSVIQFGPAVQNSMASFFRSRDKIPVFFRYLLVLAIPMAIALLITKQAYVSQEALKEQFVVLVGLVIAYLLVSPRAKSAPAGLTPSSTGFAGRAAAAFLLSISASLLVRLLIEIFSPGTVLAGDCSSEGDCQQTSGYNASTATGGAAIGGASGAIGSQLGSGEGITLLGAGAGRGGAAAGAAGAGAAGGAVGGEPTTRIVDGRAATVWLRNQGFLNADGTITDRFRTWWNSQGADGTRLDGIAGDFDFSSGRIDGDVVIIVRDPPTIPHDRPPAPVGPGAEVVTENYSPGVDITGTPDYIEHVRSYLNTMNGTDAGAELTRRLMLDGYTKVPPCTVNITDFAPDNTLGNYCEYHTSGQIQPDGSQGPGSSSRVEFNPYRHSLPGARVNPDGTPDMTDPRNRPPDVGLEHELDHSLHAAQGAIPTGNSPNPVVGGNAPTEDLRTVGVGPFGEDPTCENAYRAQRGLVPRPHY
jgi:hypothetical protein